MAYEGIVYVFDLEACLYFSDAGGNLKATLFQKAKENRIVITREIFKKVKIFDRDLAQEIEKSDIEILDLDTDVYTAASAITEIFVASGYALNAVANDKIPLIALVHCAQNGKIPPCQLVTGDIGSHSSSMKSMCQTLNIPFKDIAAGL